MIITRTENMNHYWFFMNNKTDKMDDCWLEV